MIASGRVMVIVARGGGAGCPSRVNSPLARYSNEPASSCTTSGTGGRGGTGLRPGATKIATWATQATGSANFQTSRMGTLRRGRGALDYCGLADVPTEVRDTAGPLA